jgi:hypothetical protein
MITKKLVKFILGYSECEICGTVSFNQKEVVSINANGTGRRKAYFCHNHRPVFDLIVGSFGRYHRKTSWAFREVKSMDSSYDVIIEDVELQKWFKDIYTN